MRLLWLVNCALTPDDAGATGSWLHPMLMGLREHGVTVAVIAASPVSRIERRDCGDIEQWLVPIRERLGRDGLPSRATLQQVLRIAGRVGPDLVHVWGTEFYWGLLTGRAQLAAPAILTVQGIRYRIAPRFRGDMTVVERLRSTGPREVVKHLLGRDPRRWLARAEPFEREILGLHNVVCCHSPWQAAQVLSCNAQARICSIELPLREPFWAGAWQGARAEPVLFHSSSSHSPAKGLHIALRALAVLRHRYPRIQLRVAGPKPDATPWGDGYMRWISSEVRRLGLGASVEWLGRLDASRMAKELAHASAMLLPTFVESYSMALAEAMAIGTPTVVTYTGGTSHLGKDGENCLFFALGDDAMCAYQLQRVLDDERLASRLSESARATARARHDLARIIPEQLQAYRVAVGAAR